MPKHMTMPWATDLPGTIATIHISLIDFEENNSGGVPTGSPNYDRNVIATVRYKPTIHEDAQMERQYTVGKTESERLTHNWNEEIQLSDKYSNYRGKFLTFLSKFQSMLDGHLCRITVSKHRIELTPENTQPIRSAPYRTSPKARELEPVEIEKMLSHQLIERAHMKWTALIVIAPNKVGSLHFCVDYRR